MFGEGLPDQEIAAALGATRATISNIRTQELKLFRREPYRKARSRRIDYDQVQKLYYKGWTDRAIAEACGCHPTTVRVIRTKLGLEK